MFKNSIGKRVSLLLGVISIILLSSFTAYMSYFLISTAKKSEIDKLQKQTDNLLSLVKLQNSSLQFNTDSNFKILKYFFDGEFRVDNENKIDINNIATPTIYYNDQILNLNFDLINEYTSLTKSTATIFVKTGNDFIKVSTSLRKEDGTRAIGTYLSRKSPAYQAILDGKEYIGKAKMFGKEYMTKYSPIFDKNRDLIGILYMGYDINDQLSLLKENLLNIKIGETGYVYVIGAKAENAFITLLHPTLEGKSLRGVKDTNGFDFFSEMVKKENGTISYSWKDKSGKIREKIAVYRYFEEWDWLMVSSSYLDEFLSNTYLVITKIIVVSILLTIILLSTTYTSIVFLVARPIKSLRDRARELAQGDGDLTSRLKVTREDEIGVASKEINRFIKKVQHIVQNSKESSNETSSIATELNATVLQIADRVEQEAILVENTVRSGSEMKHLLEESIYKAQSNKSDIENAKDNLQIARDEILKMVSDINHSSEVEEELSNRLTELSTSAEDVKNVLTVINDIADQTNLLALNAAIEAARAGEHGRGFAVVADEVRQLAERTQKSLNEINTTINIIVQAIVDASEQMFKNANSIKELADNSSSVEQNINQTFDIMQKSTDVANENLITTKNIVKNSQDRIEQIENINSISQSNSRSIEETAITVEHLHKMVEKLNTSLEHFKT